MSSLLRAELLRLVSRRLLVVLLVCMAGVAAFGAAVFADDARPLTVHDRQNAQYLLDSEREYFEQECSEASASSEDVCGDWEPPTDIQPFLRTPVSFGMYTERVVTFGFPIMLLAVAVLAASLVGGEFSSGNIGTQLLFTPRRSPLLIAKVVAGTVGGLLLAFAQLGATLAFSAIMFLSLRGADDMTADIDLPLSLGRVVVLALLIAVMAGALTMAVGSTLITAGVFAVTLLGSVMLADAITGFSLTQLLLPSNILWAMLNGSHEVFDIASFGYDGGPVLAHVITYDWALAYSVIGTLLIVAISLWWFRRRDILR